MSIADNTIAPLATGDSAIPYITSYWAHTAQSQAQSQAVIHVEKLPGGFIVSRDGRREIVATLEALGRYLERWSREAL